MKEYVFSKKNLTAHCTLPIVKEVCLSHLCGKEYSSELSVLLKIETYEDHFAWPSKTKKASEILHHQEKNNGNPQENSHSPKVRNNIPDSRRNKVLLHNG
jgi:hypothetical protein